MTKDMAIKSLESTRKKTIAFFDLGDLLLQRNYGEGKWNVRQILHHLADSEMIFLQRLKTVIAEPGKVIWACDQDQWNDALNYVDEPLGEKRSLYATCRTLNIQLLDKFFGIDRNFVHSEAGLRTLKEEFARIAIHNQGHLDQIEIALSVKQQDKKL